MGSQLSNIRAKYNVLASNVVAINRLYIYNSFYILLSCKLHFVLHIYIYFLDFVVTKYVNVKEVLNACQVGIIHPVTGDLPCQVLCPTFPRPPETAGTLVPVKRRTIFHSNWVLDLNHTNCNLILPPLTANNLLLKKFISDIILSKE